MPAAPRWLATIPLAELTGGVGAGEQVAGAGEELAGGAVVAIFLLRRRARAS